MIQNRPSLANSSVILKLESPTVQKLNDFTRITGFVKIRRLVDLISLLDLDANPRSSKVSNITKEITKTLEEEPELLPFKSKGILLGSSNCKALERNRFELEFNDRKIEGILDGGHNTLAIALFLLEAAGLDEKDLKRAKDWQLMKELWEQNIKDLKSVSANAESPNLNAELAIEILAPGQQEDELSTLNFLSNILNICAARNNNAQLAQETIANQGGVFDDLKHYLPANIAAEVGWRSNEPKRIDVRLLISVIWAVLNRVEMPSGVQPISGPSIYNGKAEAVKRFDQLISHPDVSTRTNNRLKIHNESILAAFELIPLLLEAVDTIYLGFKDAYNANQGKFGRIDAVKSVNYLDSEGNLKRPNITPFHGTGYDHLQPPAGFVMPIVASIGALVETDPVTKKLRWVINPVEFFADQKNLSNIISRMKGAMELAHFDPQRFGKNSAAYEIVERELEFAKMLEIRK